MIYPFDEASGEQIQDEAFTQPKEYEIDYNTGQLTGRIVEGKEAVMAWVWMALKTQRYRYYIYSWDYGQEIETLIGQGYSKEYTKAELEAMTEACLLVNPYIEGINNFEAEFQDSKLTASFSLTTQFGEVSVDVRGDDLRVSDGGDDG